MENQLGEGEYHSNLTAEERLKVSYPRIVRWSVLVATLFHAAAFVVAPAWAPAPYELPLEKEPWSLFPPAPEYAIPPPVEHVKSQIVTEIEPSDNADAEITTPSTVFNVDAPPELPPAPKRPEYFMAYDKSPEIIYQVQPEYPEFARMSELEGLVGLTVGIDEFGNVLEAKVVQSLGGGLDRAAIESIMQWRFKPAMQRDVPVPVRIYIPVRFELN